jgi:hypothetical protein
MSILLAPGAFGLGKTMRIATQRAGRPLTACSKNYRMGRRKNYSTPPDQDYAHSAIIIWECTPLSDWEEGLRRLNKTSPSENIQDSIMLIMRGQADDRSAALSATAFADTALALSILVLEPMTPPPDVDALFWNPDATYNSFFKRIKEASQRGIIGPETTENMHIARKIRNVFAHAMVDVTFASPEISEACSRLNLDDAAMKFSKGEREMRYRFCYACNNVFRHLLNWSSMPFALGISMVPEKPIQPVLP